MNDGDSSGLQSLPPVVEPPLKRSGPKPFSVAAIIIFAVLALVAFVHRNWPYLTREPITRLYYPGSAALWILHEGMLFEDGIRSLPQYGKLFAAVIGLGGADGPQLCEEALRDALKCSSSSDDDPVKADELRAHLVVLLAERGSLTNAMRELTLLSHSEKAVRFQQAFKTAYFTNTFWSNWSEVDADAETDLLSGWAAWRFTTRCLLAIGDRTKLNQHEASVAYSRQRIILPCMAVFGLAWLAQMAGLGSLGVVAFKKPFSKQSLAEFQNPPWSAKEYWGLFAASLFLALMAETVFVHLPLIGYLAWFSHCLCWLMPMLVLLAYRHWLLEPASFRQFFGISTRLESAGWLALATLALFSVAWLTLVWVPTTVEALGFRSHWSEGFDEVLRSAPWYGRVLYVMDGAIFGPVMEEILFRGLLFGALRTRLSLYPAAALSAVAFGANHFYGLAGFLSVSLFGFWCALAREKTGSLLPPIATHILTNVALIGAQNLVYSQS